MDAVEGTTNNNATLPTPSIPPNLLKENVTPSAIEGSQQQLFEGGSPIYDNRDPYGF